MSNQIIGFNDKTHYYLGIDIGSTTAKVVLIDGDTILYECYERHFSQVRQKTLELVKRLSGYMDGRPVKAAISGSAGLGMARAAGLPFVQEVFATGEAVKLLEPDTSVVIELGGEDAKVLFLKGGTEERMNGSCAGGTGAFIDQMATLMNVTNEEMDALSLQAERLYPIASRCGVFAKTDIQPLLNQGARKEDIAASIYQVVVNQTIAGLAQGRPIQGNVLYLGGPLTFSSVLRKSFDEALQTVGTLPENSLIFVALGAALSRVRLRALKWPALAGFAASVAGMYFEVKAYGENDMVLCAAPAVACLFLFLRNIEGRPRAVFPEMRALSGWIYFLHAVPLYVFTMLEKEGSLVFIARWPAVWIVLALGLMLSAFFWAVSHAKPFGWLNRLI